MAVPTAVEFSVDAKVAAHGALRTALAGGAIVALNAAGADLASWTLTSPSGSVNGTTGQLTLTAVDATVTGSVSGLCAYGEIRTSEGAVIVAMPAQPGTAAVSGKIVLHSTTVIADEDITLALGEATIG